MVIPASSASSTSSIPQMHSHLSCYGKKSGKQMRIDLSLAQKDRVCCLGRKGGKKFTAVHVNAQPQVNCLGRKGGGKVIAAHAKAQPQVAQLQAKVTPTLMESMNPCDYYRETLGKLAERYSTAYRIHQVTQWTGHPALTTELESNKQGIEGLRAKFLAAQGAMNRIKAQRFVPPATWEEKAQLDKELMKAFTDTIGSDSIARFDAASSAMDALELKLQNRLLSSSVANSYATRLTSMEGIINGLLQLRRTRRISLPSPSEFEHILSLISNMHTMLSHGTAASFSGRAKNIVDLEKTLTDLVKTILELNGSRYVKDSDHLAQLRTFYTGYTRR